MFWLPVEIIHGTTIREHDGLAMSSRNRFLSPSDRSQAGAIYQAMCQALECTSIRQAERVLAQHISGAGLAVQYAEIRHSSTLAKQSDDATSGRMLVAAKLGSIRLIDNMAWQLPR
jgi:pantoate--beta-alanine ligase